MKDKRLFLYEDVSDDGRERDGSSSHYVFDSLQELNDFLSSTYGGLVLEEADFKSEDMDVGLKLYDPYTYPTDTDEGVLSENGFWNTDGDIIGTVRIRWVNSGKK
jgi:hypothetical protein